MSEVISVVVPVFNNQPTLEETFRQIAEVHHSSFRELALEVIFVNDGSTDESWEELVRLRGLHQDTIGLLNLSRNFGQVGAWLAGFARARGDAVICISADLQDPISLMGKMVALWRNGMEIVICRREDRMEGVFSRILSNVAYSIARVSCPEMPAGGFDYWLMSRKVCKLLCSLKGRHNFPQIYLLSVGFSKAFISYTRMPRKAGRSGYTFSKKLKMVIDALVDSYVPIRFMSYLGAFIAVCAVLYTAVIIYAWAMHKVPFSGWAPLMIVSMLVGGVLMIMLGVIGEYVWRIHDNLKAAPVFIIETDSVSAPDETRSASRLAHEHRDRGGDFEPSAEATRHYGHGA